jgi:monoamine oxidase
MPRIAFSKRKTVIVAGAGMAGLYAAYLLKRRGFRVTLLEASDRVGGKVLRTQSRGVYLDEGGQAFSTHMKRVAALGKAFGLTRVKKPRQKIYASIAGSVVAAPELTQLRAEVNAWNERVDGWVAEARSPAWREEKKNLFVGDLLSSHFSSRGETYYRSLFLTEWCQDCSKVGFLYFLEVTAGFKGDEANEMDFRFHEGMGALAEKLAAAIKNELRLQTRIDAIEASGSGVVVRAGDQVWRADHLVCALPAKVWPTLKTTGLPGSWRDWASGFSDGSVRKILLQFEKPFWKGRAAEGTITQPEGVWTMDNSNEPRQEFSLAVFVGPSSLALPLSTILASLVPVFGEEVRSPIAVIDTLWTGDQNLSGGYAANRGAGNFPMPPVNHGRVWQAGTEWAAEFPSYIEGALASAEVAVAGIAKGI